MAAEALMPGGGAHNGASDSAGPATEKLEKGGTKQTELMSESPEDCSAIPPDAEPYIVDWDSADDPQNPKNWTYGRKWAATLVASSFPFITLISSTMSAPASDDMARDLGIHSSTETAMITSIFVLGFAFGPLFWGPMSEIYGRSKVLQVANLFYLAWNLGCGFAHSSSALIVFRLLAGLGSAAPLAVCAGIIGDTWKTEERGQALAVYSLAPLLGPSVGPIAGAWISGRTTWRWVFWSTSIVGAVVQVCGLVFLRETFAPVLLERKAACVRASMELEKPKHTIVRTVYESDDRRWQAVFKRALTRPFILFFTEPIIQLLGLYNAFVYGLIYIFFTTMPPIFENVYGESTGVAGLHYIAIGVGFLAGAQTNSRTMDRTYAYCVGRYGGAGKPEYRLPSLVPGTILVPAGFLVVGWAAVTHTHWIVVDIGIVLIGIGTQFNFQGVQSYVIDAFTLHAASALAAVVFLRSVAGFAFPLFAPAMYAALGFGEGNTVLAAVGVAIGCPAPWVFWRYGERIRRRSRYAAGRM